MAQQIESVIVLMLENRSFDHMLGYLPHPDASYPRLTGSEENPAAEPAEPPVRVSPSARPTLALDPAHDHADVLLQLTGKRAPQPPFTLNNSGFVVSYEGVGLRKKERRGFGPLIMKCQPDGNLPVLAALATGFAVCTNWFSSVPGQTWPNRNFAHAATSDGEVDNSLRFYTDPTIFELLGRVGRSWQVYHQGAAQSWAFRQLWSGAPGGGFGSHGDLLTAIANDRLPHYAFVEPDHFWPFSSSQHPGNNEKSGNDFARAEDLLRTVYAALLAQPQVFAKTLLVVTYDEHGGLYDRQAPPYDPRYRDGKVASGGFTFDLLGVRVPAVLVSPWIAAGRIDTRTYDHSSIVATLRQLFAPQEPALTPRDAQATPFADNLTLQAPRAAADMPQLPAPAGEAPPAPTIDEAPDETQLDDFQRSLVWLTEKVAAELQADGVDVTPSADDGRRRRGRGGHPHLGGAAARATGAGERAAARAVDRAAMTSRRKEDAMSDELKCELAEGPPAGEAKVQFVVVRRVQKSLTYADQDGMAIFEGDIAIATTAKLAAGNGAFIPMGVGISGSEYRWPGGVVPYEIAVGMPAPDRITAAIAHWNEKTKLRLVERTGANAANLVDYVRFEPGSGCWSYVGRQGGPQTISVGPTCTPGNVIHEIGHAIGLWHEQSREDRETYVTVNFENIAETNKHNFRQHVLDGDDLGGYDYDSIMHYPAKAFSKNNLPTIVPKQNKPIGQRKALSAGDLLAVKMLYPELYT